MLFIRTFKLDCDAFLYITLTDDNQKLIIRDLQLEHNGHDGSEVETFYLLFFKLFFKLVHCVNKLSFRYSNSMYTCLRIESLKKLKIKN